MRKNITSNVSWVGYLDWDLKKFHGDDYNITSGSSQNAYLIEEEKTVLIDTVWAPHRCDFIKNLKKEVDLKKIDFIVINHGECDHSGSLPCLMKLIPNTPIYCSAAAKSSLEGQYGERGWNFKIVKTGDEISIGNDKKLIFLDMKMLHWPDSMATYLTKDNILFSNDAFGAHLASQELFSDMVDPCVLEKESLKYFVNILNPFSTLILKKLEEIEKLNLKIDIIAPSHGAIWRKNPSFILEKYKTWAKNYKENQVTIIFDTMWNGTKKIAYEIANKISCVDPEVVVKIFNISKSDKNEVATEIFKSKSIAVGSPTVGNSILSSMAGFLEYLKQLKFKGKKAAAFGCYGWSGESVNILKKKLDEIGFEVVEDFVRCLWKPKEKDLDDISKLVTTLI